MDKIIPIHSGKETQKLFGPQDQNLRLIQDAFDIHVSSRAEGIKISSKNKDLIEKADDFISYLLSLIRSGRELSKKDIVFYLKQLLKEM